MGRPENHCQLLQRDLKLGFFHKTEVWKTKSWGNRMNCWIYTGSPSDNISLSLQKYCISRSRPGRKACFTHWRQACLGCLIIFGLIYLPLLKNCSLFSATWFATSVHLQLYLAEGTAWVLPAAAVNELHISPSLPWGDVWPPTGAGMVCSIWG